MKHTYIGMALAAVVFGALLSATIRYIATGSPTEVITFTLTNR